METTAKPETTPRDRMREKATDLKTDLRELGEATRQAARETADHYLDDGKKKYGEIEEQVVTYVRENPVKSVLIAAGAGLLIGMLASRR